MENKNINKKKKAQLKIQETAFMLLALVFLFALIFIFYTNYQATSLFAEKANLQKERAISLLTKLAEMPEFACSEGNCVDEDKIAVLKNITAYEKLWQGMSSVKVMRIYPANQTRTYVIYKKSGAREDITYSAYIPLCATKYLEGYVIKDCDLAKLLVSIEEVKQQNEGFRVS